MIIPLVIGDYIRISYISSIKYKKCTYNTLTVGKVVEISKTRIEFIDLVEFAVVHKFVARDPIFCFITKITEKDALEYAMSRKVSEAL